MSLVGCSGREELAALSKRIDALEAREKSLASLSAELNSLSDRLGEVASKVDALQEFPRRVDDLTRDAITLGLKHHRLEIDVDLLRSTVEEMKRSAGLSREAQVAADRARFEVQSLAGRLRLIEMDVERLKAGRPSY